MADLGESTAPTVDGAFAWDRREHDLPVAAPFPTTPNDLNLDPLPTVFPAETCEGDMFNVFSPDTLTVLEDILFDDPDSTFYSELHSGRVGAESVRRTIMEEDKLKQLAAEDGEDDEEECKCDDDDEPIEASDSLGFPACQIFGQTFIECEQQLQKPNVAP